MWVDVIRDDTVFIEETLAELSPLIHRPQLATESAELLRLIAQDRKRVIADAATKSAVPIHPLRLISELQKILTPDQVPVCLMLLSAAGARTGNANAARPLLLSNVLAAVRELIVWAPVLAIILVIGGVGLPKVVSQSRGAWLPEDIRRHSHQKLD